MRVTASRTISMGHRLPSYDGICSSPHGHNVRVEVEVLVVQGQFVDFKALDDALRDRLADLDHAMVLHEQDPLLPVLQGMGFRTVSLSAEPTTENLAVLLLGELQLWNGRVTRVTVFETEKYSATVFAGHQGEVRRRA